LNDEGEEVIFWLCGEEPSAEPDEGLAEEDEEGEELGAVGSASATPVPAARATPSPAARANAESGETRLADLTKPTAAGCFAVAATTFECVLTGHLLGSFE
jgi:hypothetical protein